MAAAGLLLGFLTLWLRVAWLQLVQHGYYAERAERHQERRIPLPPMRGALLDRYGHPLARDLVSYVVTAEPRRIPDVRSAAHRLARELGLDPLALEREFAKRPGFVWVTRHADPEHGLEIASWKMPGIEVQAETQREYPLGDAACEIVGRTNIDHAGVDGLELELDDELRGQAGWSTLTVDGRGQRHLLPGARKRSAEDGRSIVLTLDRDLQASVEHHLARAVDTLQAVRGFALFLDPRTGEILASANVPHLPPGRARNWNFTDQYEPGSTFKIVAASGALEEGLARPDEIFTASADGKLEVVKGCVLHDTHKHAEYTFRDAIRFSSNIVMGKLGLLLGPERLYRYATQLGFGALTGVGFPGETGGRLRSPDHWSGRSCPTIAIGHEVSVTPIQLALAYAAIANGGILMQPMLVREVRDPDSTLVKAYEPRASQRVLSARTTELLRTMLTAVVDSGTAKAARIPGLTIAGKTGTAQKYDAATHGYGAHMYLSSFVGFVPAEHPTLVGVVVIDEPHGAHYYGGEVAAPVFREILLDLQRLQRDEFRSAGQLVAAPPPQPAPVVTPDVRLLPPQAAGTRLAEFGLHGRLAGQGPRVLAQDPPAGAETDRGAAVTLWLSTPPDSAGRVLPDLVGTPVREALRRLALLEVKAFIEGRGTVVRQDPPAGTPVPRARGCRLWCEPGPTRVTATAEPPAPSPSNAAFSVDHGAASGAAATSAHAVNSPAVVAAAGRTP